jgi:hypothetical protein
MINLNIKEIHDGFTRNEVIILFWNHMGCTFSQGNTWSCVGWIRRAQEFSPVWVIAVQDFPTKIIGITEAEIATEIFEYQENFLRNLN